jgi:hypothetical protein
METDLFGNETTYGDTVSGRDIISEKEACVSILRGWKSQAKIRKNQKLYDNCEKILKFIETLT